MIVEQSIKIMLENEPIWPTEFSFDEHFLVYEEKEIMYFLYVFKEDLQSYFVYDVKNKEIAIQIAKQLNEDRK